jgi:hypothetical protein
MLLEQGLSPQVHNARVSIAMHISHIKITRSKYGSKAFGWTLEVQRLAEFLLMHSMALLIDTLPCDYAFRRNC